MIAYFVEENHDNWDRFLREFSSSGRGSRVVWASDRGWLCHEFEPSTTKDPPSEQCDVNLHSLTVAKSPRAADQCDVNLHSLTREFSFALRTAVNETTGKTPAELFLGRKIITPFRKLINVTDGAEYVGGNIEKLFDEARQNMRKQHETWERYYNRKRREGNIKVNDLVLVQTHFVSAAVRRVVGKFMPKSEGPYRVFEVRNNNLTIWKKGHS
ncbi:uncharacterized protein TNCV_5037111 [Trichonephila clavipes]|nr:uncharacterized protein TNCV_5037111 [Trichonephila clavipes]